MTDPRGYIGTKVDTRPDSYYSDGLLIHNYFPDGAITSDALIAVGTAQYPDGKIIYPENNTETIAVMSGDGPGGGNAVKVTTTGASWEEGMQVGLVAATTVPGAGIYHLAFDLKCLNGNQTLKCQAYCQNVDGQRNEDLPIFTYWTRYSVPLYAFGADILGCHLSFQQKAYAADATPPALSWEIANIMFTDGDGWAFRDGDSDGWAWTGTPHESASYGPQP
jgi:hypothetical protein